jgi:hypothetical protein
MEAIGTGATIAYHHAYEFGGPDAVLGMPGGQALLAVITSIPPTSVIWPYITTTSSG